MKNTIIIVIILTLTSFIFSQSVDVKDSADHTLITINDEGDMGGSITIPDATLITTSTDNKLYNLGGTLNWNGSPLGTAGSAGGWSDDGAIVRLSNVSDKVGIGTAGPLSKLSVGGTGFGIVTIYGLAPGGNGRGVMGSAPGASGSGVYGESTYEGSSPNFGGYFTSKGASGHGVYAKSTGAFGRAIEGAGAYGGSTTNYGGYFHAGSETSRAVYGESYKTGYGENYGGYFTAAGNSGHGVYGEATADGSVTNYGGEFVAAGETGVGTYGYATHTTGINFGVRGKTDSPVGWAGYFEGRGYFSKNVGIGTTIPTANLQVVGNDGVLLTGTLDAGTIPVEGAGTRMMWFPKRAAFRAGHVSGAQWNEGNIGKYSTAMGANTTASGWNSVALGSGSTASQESSFAMGASTTASGVASTAFGLSTIASGDQSTAMGSNTTASGNYSTAIGRLINAESYSTVVIGRYNVGGGNPTSWVETDPLFEIGNGAYLVPNNAMTVLKNGNVGIGLHNPKTDLHVDNTIRVGGYYSSYPSLGGTLSHAGGGNGFKISANAGGGWADMHLQTDGTTRLFIESAGNVGIGTTSPTKRLYVNGSAGGTQAWNASDERYKKNINTLNNSLERILKLRGVEYEWKDQSKDESTGFDDKVHYGVIAQEVEEVFPHLVDNIGNTDLMKHVEYNGLIGILIEAVKELNHEIELLKQSKEN